MAETVPTLLGVPIKYLVLCFLVFQNGGAVLLMRAVRALPGQNDFVTQTAVIMQEVLKAGTCSVILLIKDGSLSATWEDKVETLKTSVPALLYLVQNNLQYVAVGYLDAPTYAVTYQTKIFWVAVCSKFLLDKTVHRYQWLALTMLMSGVCFVQLGQSSPSSAGGDDPTSSGLKALGIGLLLAAALCSSLAAVAFEKLLKGSTADMWTRNLQLAFFSLLCSILPLMLSPDLPKIWENGFFYGYIGWTWACIAMNGWGGLLIGAVIKYADAILKDMAIGASICVSAFGSVLLFGAELSPNTLSGIFLVSWAVPLYAGRANFGLAWLSPQAVQDATKKDQVLAAVKELEAVQSMGKPAAADESPSLQPAE